MSNIKTWQERTINMPPETLLISIETFRFMQAEIDDLRTALEKAEQERDAALARLAELEKQGPVMIYEGRITPKPLEVQ